MSIKVDVGDLPEALVDQSDHAFLLTTNSDMSPHVANVQVDLTAGILTVSAGRRSCANATDRPAVTLLWPNQGQDSMSLLVDGTATDVAAEDGFISVSPSGAIWHRHPAEAPAG